MDGAPEIGWAVWVKNLNAQYTWDGSAWVTISLDIYHNLLAGLQGGIENERVHQTQAEHDASTRLANDINSGLMPPGKLTSWDSAWHDGDILTENVEIATVDPSIKFHDTNDGVTYMFVNDTNSNFKNFHCIEELRKKGYSQLHLKHH